jgi:hypothetical protein
MVIKFMNNNKSRGVYNIAAELYEKRVGLLLNKLHSLIKGIWKEKRTSKVWTKTITVRDQVSPTLKTQAVLSFDTPEHKFHTWCRNPK